jgi:tetratricopeptide (TPR) repeat protein
LVRYQEAVDIYEKEKNTSITKILHHTQALMFLGRFDAAIKLCNEQLEQKRDERVLVAAACVEYRAGRNENAKKYLEEWYFIFLTILTFPVLKNSLHR